MALDLLNPKTALDLGNIRYTLIRLEDTIIFNLIERAQFPLNRSIYVAGAVPLPNFDGSFLDWLLTEVERTHGILQALIVKLNAKIRRYQSPDEYPFTSDLPDPIIPPLQYPPLLHKNQNINVNSKIYKSYVNDILPRITQNLPDKGESSENYGSTAVRDVECLQSLSRRIHFGKFVAEVKFQSDEAKMTELIKKRDSKGLEEAITNAAVERQVLQRLATKARTYGKDPSAGAEALKSREADKVDVDAVVAIYRDLVIPLTKEVEVEYLLARLD